MVLPGDAVAERHARVRIVDGALWLDDLGSPSGTFVNDARVGSIALAPGDRVRVGDHVFVVVVAG